MDSSSQIVSITVWSENAPCLFCVSKGVMSTAECGGVHEGKEEE